MDPGTCCLNLTDGPTEKEIWETLGNKNYGNCIHEDVSIKFITRIYLNDFQYVKDNYMLVPESDINECFLVSIGFSARVDIIEFLNQVFKKNINIESSDYLLYACSDNPNTRVIKYLIDDKSMDPYVKDEKGLNCLMRACSHNESLEVIKYLINVKNMDPRILSPMQNDCFMLSCSTNVNLDIIKYLRQVIEPELEYLNINYENCLTLACTSNPNINVIKYLIELMDIDHSDDDNYIEYAISINPNLNVAKYLIENTPWNIRFGRKNNTRFKELIRLMSKTKNYQRFNDFISRASRHYDNICSFISEVNPLMIDRKILNRIHPVILSDYEKTMIKEYNYSYDCPKNDKCPFFQDPFILYKYVDFIQKVDSLTCKIPFKISDIGNMSTSDRIIPRIDFTRPSQELFKHQGIIYHGDRKVTLGSMLLFNDCEFDFKELPELSPGLPGYLVSLYLKSCYDGYFDMNQIDTNDDFIQFLKFIDQYPTIYLSVSKCEKEIVQYMLEHDVRVIQCVKDMCNRYQLKHLYIHICHKYYIES